MLEIETLKERFDNLKSERGHFDKAWEDCRIYALPSSLPIYGDSYVPDERDRKNFDSTAELSARHLASNITSSTTNPSNKWVQLESMNDEVNQDRDVKEFFEACENQLMKSYENSNFYIRKHEADTSLVVFGTGIMFIEENDEPGKDFNFRTIHISEAYLAENHKGDVDTIFRYIKMTARQLVQKFGIDSVSDKTRTLIEKQSDEYIYVVHATFPREDRDIMDTGEFRQGSDNFAFASVWWEEEQNHLLEESGFYEFPYYVVRWNKEPGVPYGHGPIMEGLSDIKLLNQMEKTRIKLAQRIADPPHAVMGGDSQEIKLIPGATTHFDEEVRIQLLVEGSNYPITSNSIEIKRRQVQDALYENQLQGIEKEMTAEEVRAISLENLRRLGPVGQRIDTEGMRTLNTRCLGILARRGKIPEIPELLRNEGPRFRYMNQFSRAMRQDDVRAIVNALTIGGQLKDLYPETKYVLDAEQAYKYICEQTGVPPSLLYGDAEIRRMKQIDAQIAQQQQQIILAGKQAELQESQAKTREKTSRAVKNERGA